MLSLEIIRRNYENSMKEGKERERRRRRGRRGREGGEGGGSEAKESCKYYCKEWAMKDRKKYERALC